MPKAQTRSSRRHSAEQQAVIRIGGEKAFYRPSTDHIQLPPESAFRGPPEWAATALHELGHWTGHKSRLNLEDGMNARSGSAAYAMEELRAGLSSAFIAGELGIPADIPQHTSYIKLWLGPLKKGQEGNLQGGSRRATHRRYASRISSRL